MASQKHHKRSVEV